MLWRNSFRTMPSKANLSGESADILKISKKILQTIKHFKFKKCLKVGELLMTFYLLHFFLAFPKATHFPHSPNSEKSAWVSRLGALPRLSRSRVVYFGRMCFNENTGEMNETS